jgi:hypothetical protein
MDCSRLPLALLIALPVDPWPAQAAAGETCFRDDAGRIVERRQPGYVQTPCPQPDSVFPDPAAARAADNSGDRGDPRNVDRGAPPEPNGTVSPAAADLQPSIPVPDRWRIVDMLGRRPGVLDPYHRNRLKGDAPLRNGWFFSLGVVSDTVFEQRDVVTPAGATSTSAAGSNDVFGRPAQSALQQTVAVELVYYRGDTVFMPPEYELRFTPVISYSHLALRELGVVNIDPREGSIRNDYHVGVQAAFVEKHLRTVSERYDFDSLRIGIQPFNSDFRGFLFQDNQLGVRLFGNRDNNRYQYNLAWFRRLEKDSNSGLNDLAARWRADDVLVANIYRQDFPVPGFTSQLTAAYNRNREGSGSHYNSNGVVERPAALGRQVPRDYDVLYLGLNGDGHFGRTNVTASAYLASGRESPGVFVARTVGIRAGFAALELSRDYDWLRPRLSFLYASGDHDPYDTRATGFDAIFENPQFAGADNSFWIRQSVPLVGGGGVSLSGRNGVLNSLRSSKEQGQSNFTNPGTVLLGAGVDMDVLPQLRVSFNVNHLAFADTAVLAAVRNQAPPPATIGEDLSAAVTWRPLLSQNIVLRASYAELLARGGYAQLFPDARPACLLLNAVLTY